LPETIAILGGTGKEGQGLALRWASSGRTVILGSRDGEKGHRVASELNDKLGSSKVSGTTNADAAGRAGVVVSTLPYDGQLDTIASMESALEGKLLVTATVRWPPSLDGKPSAAEELAETLRGRARVAAAFQTVSAGVLRDLEGSHDEDVLVFGDEDETRRETLELVEATGFRGVEAGPLKQSRIAEAITGLLLGVNKLHGVRSAGVRFTGLPGKK
jgi:NADPH-dependent F420 reductase